MKVLVYGAGGHGRVVADVAVSAGGRVVAFVDDGPGTAGRLVAGAPVLDWSRLLFEQDRWRDSVFALGIGDGQARAEVFDRVCATGWEPKTLVHASAIVARTVDLGAGTVVMAAAVVNPDARTERGCIINTGAIVEHDCQIGAFVLVGPNATLGGGVEVGEQTLIGVGAAVRPGVRIGAQVTVGAGAAVVDDIPDGSVVGGVPARPLRARQPAPTQRGAAS